MATNNFKAFALDPNANVMSQADWEALPALLSGFTAGKASSAQVNKAIRQATTIAALVGQFIANSGADALDNADVNGLVTKFTNALIANLRLGAGAPAIGIPFFWPSSAMPNTVMTEWADMVFLKFNGATFSAATYPKLALVFPGLTLTEARGEFLRIWDDGRGVDSGRALLSAQSDDFKTHEHKFLGTNGSGSNVVFGTVSNSSPLYTNGISQPGGSALPAFQNPGGTETRPRNIAFNFLVRAK
ncbi:phage tail protein [Enterobacter asburiae]|uniref:Phage tail protein n=1 Tax=Enterobacter asburiae TaxID=61645 RepID=A0AAQ0ENL2_ENTAS|nr:phage tail protein [Enterobacter asburiae]QYD25865.1 phage tail protein [Enterobacter asburiae]